MAPGLKLRRKGDLRIAGLSRSRPHAMPAGHFGTPEEGRMPPWWPGYWQELRSPEFEALDPERTVALLPVGAVEQHGPHLPVMVDACLNQAIVERALGLLPEGTPVLVLPLTSHGKSAGHCVFPGPLPPAAETLGRVWHEIGVSVRRAGVRKLLFL